jgi:hypothetical protein
LPLPLGFFEWLTILSTYWDDVHPFLKMKRFELLDVAKLLLLFAVSIFINYLISYYENKYLQTVIAPPLTLPLELID